MAAQPTILPSPVPEGQTRKQYMEAIAYTAFIYGFVPMPIRDKIPVTGGWTEFRNDPVEDRKDMEAGKYPKSVRRVGHLIQFRGANNVGIVTGEASGVVVIDVDTENNGVNVWNELVKMNEELPKTLTVQTSSGGFHFYFKYTPDLAGVGNINRILRYPFDYRTNNGMIVFPGSFDRYNRQYKILSGYEPSADNPQVKLIYIAEMPVWLKTLLVMDRIVKEDKGEPNPQSIADKAGQLGVILSGQMTKSALKQ